MQRAFFRDAYRDDAANWDVPGPQPAFVMAAAAGEVAGPVLDLGCGTGENALFFDLLGLAVLGIDRERRAIVAAQDKATRCDARARFRIGDALRPAVPRHWAGTIVDSAFFHGLDARQRTRYWRMVTEALRPGGKLLLLAFDDATLRRQLREAPKGALRGPVVRPAYYLLRGDGACDAEPAVLAMYEKVDAKVRAARPKRPRRKTRP